MSLLATTGIAAESAARLARVLLILPCYNEGKTVGKLIAEINGLGRGYDIVVVDDGSSDDTYAEASKRSPCIRLIYNLGIGGAVQTGIKYAYRNGYDFCIQIDGDGQHPPSQIAQLIKAHADRPTNIVVGSRYLDQESFRSTWARRLGSAMIAGTLNSLFKGIKITDPTSGMRMLDRAAMAFFSTSYPHDYPEPISLAWAAANNLTVGETAVMMRSREHGVSSINGLKTLAYMIRVLCYVALARFQESPR
jgi:glycosyltransferase involved in cell wall biosynthesis